MTTPNLSSIANPGNFLRTTRHFPQDPQELSVELNKMYTEASTQVNNRISGIFGTQMTITGESWYLNGEKGRQQSLRRAYKVTGAGSIPHEIVTSSVSGFTRIYGSFTDGTNFYPLPYVSTTAANQVQVVITQTNIVITAGGGAPAIVSGVIVLEWLSAV